jgi:hypothetical protein
VVIFVYKFKVIFYFSGAKVEKNVDIKPPCLKTVNGQRETVNGKRRINKQYHSGIKTAAAKTAAARVIINVL